MPVDNVIEEAPSLPVAPLPLVIDLDGTLIHSDLLIETFFRALGRDIRVMPALARSFFHGKASFKAKIAEFVDIDPTILPYDAAVIEMANEARDRGRPIFLASASNEKFVAAVAQHLGFFDGWFASTASENLSGERKAAKLVEAFGARQFAYAGNSSDDIAVWRVAGECILVNCGKRTEQRFHRETFEAAATIKSTKPGWKQWVKLLRVHQYAKNALVFVPLLASHSFNGAAALNSVLAFFAFSFVASSVYIINDLTDVQSDRSHPRKRLRPFAAGTIMPLSGILLAAFSLGFGLALSAFVSWQFACVVVLYLGLTTAYTFDLKRRMLVDVLALSMLYAVRVIGGAVAIQVTMSEWLLAFSLFIFTSLALIKRYTELSLRLDQSLPDPTDRNYRVTDLPIVAAFAASAGFNAVTVFTLYIASDSVQKLYSRPYVLWLVCPILLYWIGRSIMMAHRRLMHDDPVIFAISDGRSRIAVAAVAILFVLAL